MESCASSSDSSSSSLLERLPLAETSPGCAPPCIRAVSLPFIWRVLSAVGTLSFAACSAQSAPVQGDRGPGLHGHSRGGSCAQGSRGLVWAAAGIAPRKHVHFWSLACPATPGASPWGSPFLCNCHDTPCILSAAVRARQPLCPSRALGDGEAFCRAEHSKGRARQPQPPRGRPAVVLAVLPVGFGFPQRADAGLVWGTVGRSAELGVAEAAQAAGRQWAVLCLSWGGWAALNAHPCSSPRLRLSVSTVTWAVLLVLLLHSWSFIASPSPSWSFGGSACEERGCVHPSDQALPSHWDFSPCPLASLSGIFIFLTLNTMQCLFWVWDLCIKWGLPMVSYFAFDWLFGLRQITYPSVLGVPVGQAKLIVTDTKRAESSLAVRGSVFAWGSALW